MVDDREIELKIALDTLSKDKQFMKDIETYYFLVNLGLAKPIIDVGYMNRQLTFKLD